MLEYCFSCYYLALGGRTWVSARGHGISVGGRCFCSLTGDSPVPSNQSRWCGSGVPGTLARESEVRGGVRVGLLLRCDSRQSHAAMRLYVCAWPHAVAPCVCSKDNPGRSRLSLEHTHTVAHAVPRPVLASAEWRRRGSSGQWRPEGGAGRHEAKRRSLNDCAAAAGRRGVARKRLRLTRMPQPGSEVLGRWACDWMVCRSGLAWQMQTRACRSVRVMIVSDC